MLKKLVCGLWLVALMSAGLAEAPSPYKVEVDLTSQIVTVYDAADSSTAGIARQMICSSGTPGSEDATPCGEFEVRQHYPDERSAWYYIDQYDVYVQYVTRFNGPYLFHSLPYFQRDVATIDTRARSLLGQPVSHGCIRLRSEDAQWLALNCPDGTPVRVFEGDRADEALRARLLKSGYAREDWDSYEQFLAADIHAGLTGALEQLLKDKEGSPP